jgi:hypothetical protein
MRTHCPSLARSCLWDIIETRGVLVSLYSNCGNYSSSALSRLNSSVVCGNAPRTS